MFKKKKNIKDLEKEYQYACKIINSYQNHFCILHVSYKGFWYFAANLISFAARLKGRKNKTSHTACIIPFSDPPFILEASKKRGGVVSGCMKDRYFSRSFSGSVIAHFIPVETNLIKVNDFVERSIGKRYSTKKAWFAWFDLFRIEKDDNDNEVFCNDIVLDFYDEISGDKLRLINSEDTPSELMDFLRLKMKLDNDLNIKEEVII